MAGVWCLRLRRAFASGSRVLFIAGPPIVAAAIAAGTKTFGVTVPLWIVVGGLLGVLLLLVQAFAEYRVRTYDPTLAFRFDDRFYDDEMKDSIEGGRTP